MDQQIISKSDIKKLTENISNEFQNILKFLIEDVKEIDPSLHPKNIKHSSIEIINNNLETDFHNDSNTLTVDECIDIMEQLDKLEEDFDNLPGAKKPVKTNLRKFNSKSSLSGSISNLTTRSHDRTMMPPPLPSMDITNLMPPPALPGSSSEKTDEVDDIIELNEDELIEFNNLRKIFIMKLQTGMISGINDSVKETINQSMEKLFDFLEIMVTELTALYGSNNNGSNDTIGIDEETLSKLKTLNEVRNVLSEDKQREWNK